MVAKKRTPQRRGFVQEAVKAGRRALRDAESRVPPDLRKQLERTITDGQKALTAAIRQLESQVRRTARQADVDKALKRLESLSRQVQKLARGAASGASRREGAKATRKPAARSRRAAGSPRKSPTEKTAAAKPAARRTAARKAPVATAAPAAAAAPRPARRRAPRLKRAPAAPEIHSVPPAPAPGPVPESVESEP